MGEPLYIVNGAQRSTEEFQSIATGVIKDMVVLQGEEAVEKYGLKGSDGVVEVTLYYDTVPLFADNQSFEEYLREHVKWQDNESVARVIVKYRVLKSGDIEVVEVMESTDSRLRKRTLKALEESPKWRSPAMNMGEAVEYTDIVKLQLPQGRQMPRERVLIMR